MGNISTDSMSIAPGVVETIVSIAAREVAGVVSVGEQTATTGIVSLFTQKQTAPGVSVQTNNQGELEVIVSLVVENGYSLTTIAEQVRSSVAEAIITQVGLPIARVDVYVDGIQFRD